MEIGEEGIAVEDVDEVCEREYWRTRVTAFEIKLVTWWLEFGWREELLDAGFEVEELHELGGRQVFEVE